MTVTKNKNLLTLKAVLFPKDHYMYCFNGFFNLLMFQKGTLIEIAKMPFLWYKVKEIMS